MSECSVKGSKYHCVAMASRASRALAFNPLPTTGSSELSPVKIALILTDRLP